MKRCGNQPDFCIFNCVKVMGGVPSISILMCGIHKMCRLNSPPFSDPRNTSLGYFADVCKLHWVILNVVSLNSVKYFIF